MSCSPYDLRDYFFDELPGDQRGHVRAHLKTCEPCGAELESLRLTQSALLAVRDEEIPQRIGFVSDKVFEPSPVWRWFTGFWTSAARIGFVSSAMLSAAILVHAFIPVHNSAQSAQSISTQTQAEIDRRVHDALAVQMATQIDNRVASAVAQAVADSEQRAQKRTNAILAAAEKRFRMDHWTLAAQFEQSREYAGIRKNLEMVKSNYGSSLQ